MTSPQIIRYPKPCRGRCPGCAGPVTHRVVRDGVTEFAGCVFCCRKAAG